MTCDKPRGDENVAPMDAMLRVYGVVDDSIVDGPGIRLSVFTQGCFHGCPGCHNLESHDSGGGKLVSIHEIVKRYTGNPLLSGVTLTGGEPMEQAAQCLALVLALPRDTNLWLYSGYTYEELIEQQNPDRLALLKACNILVDGRYNMENRSLSLLYRGSANQRLIDLRRTFEVGKVILWEAAAWI